MNRTVKRGLWVVMLAAVAVAVGAWYTSHDRPAATVWRTEPVRRGDLVATIAATGTVEPEEVVDVGAQVAGQIVAFGKDRQGRPIDYGSVVEEGMVLAQIDDLLYAADLAHAEAQLEQAQAGVRRAEADILQFKAKLLQAERDWARAQKLQPTSALSQAEYDAYQAAYDTAKANVAVGEAALVQARAAVSQAQAVLARARRNLGYCTIRSPVHGVIIDRRVNIGQTVVASLSAPSLFLIAKDLRRLQVWVSVNEADIGQIRPGQPATFTVDAFPGQVFQGQVSKVRLNATMTQNVVTYTVEVATANPDGRLLPYLTANVHFEVGRRSNVLMVPNAALRWRPTRLEQVAPGDRAALASGRATAQTRPAAEASPRRTVWVEEDGWVRPVQVRVGLTDGTSTEVQGEGVQEGMRVVVGEQSAVARSGPPDLTNPFVAQPLRRGRP